MKELEIISSEYHKFNILSINHMGTREDIKGHQNSTIRREDNTDINILELEIE